MNHFINKDGVILMLFRIKENNVAHNDRLRRWNKLFSCFHYTSDIDLHLLYFRILERSYIGFSLRAVNDAERRAQRYAEGLAYQLVYHFSECEIVPLTQEELLTVMDLLYTRHEWVQEFDGDSRPLVRLLFAKVLNPLLLLNKFSEFYLSDQKHTPTSFESRVGIKPKSDCRLLPLLEQAYLAYCFDFFASSDAAKENASLHQTAKVEPIVLDAFLEQMRVPDKYLDYIKLAKNASELFDKGTVQLASPLLAAQFVVRE
jgi:hypothetical protein